MYLVIMPDMLYLLCFYVAFAVLFAITELTNFRRIIVVIFFLNLGLFLILIYNCMPTFLLNGTFLVFAYQGYYYFA